MRKGEMSGKILGIALVWLIIGLMFAGVVSADIYDNASNNGDDIRLNDLSNDIITNGIANSNNDIGISPVKYASTAAVDEYFIYSSLNPEGIDDVVAAGGYVEYYGVPEWGDEVQYLYFLSGNIGYKVKVWVTDGDGDGKIEPRQHPNHYLSDYVGPIEPRHSQIVSSADLTGYTSGSGGHSEEFHVDSSGVYLGAYPNGIHKWDHNWNYLGKVANSPPERTESMAYNPAENVWYAGGRTRTIYELRDTDNDGGFLDESWAAIFTYSSYGGGHHDGLEYVGGYLWISDMTSDVIGKWQYNTTTNAWEELKRFTYTEPADVEGMGFGPNDHFWCGSGWGSESYIYELGNEITKGYPLAEAGADVEAHPPTIPVKFDASGSHHTDPAKQIILYEWDFESDGTWDYSFGRFVYPTGKSGPYTYAGWLAGGPGMLPYQNGYYHLGQDIEANEGDDVYAIADGKIIYVSVGGWGEGNFGLLIKHKLNTGEDFLALYGHVRPNSEDLRRTISGHVDPSVPVVAGEAFATIGPYDSIPHLHFGIRPGGEVPPSPWGRMPLERWSDTNGFVDPLEWITTQTPLKPVPLYVEHTYPAYYNPDGSIDWDKSAKDYTASLRVTDNSDPPLRDTDTCMVHITAPPWKPVADPNGPYEGWVGTPIQFDGSKSYDPESKMFPPDHPWYETIAKYEWDLDYDGEFDDSTDVKPSWTWDSQGIYIVGLKITDSQASGPGGTIGPLDVDIKYATVTVKKPEAILFAPNMWFGSTEHYFPITPFFYTDDIYETSGEKSKTKYLGLTDDQKWDNFTVFYHVAETEDESVYEYWFYHAYNDFINEHYHDWETIYVFVDKNTEEVTRVVASAHGDWIPNNEYLNPQFAEGEHAGILVEEGSHASCTDRNNNGLFEPITDVTNWDAYGILFWNEEDQLNGCKIEYNDLHYTLKEINGNFILMFKGLDTFPNSPELGWRVTVPIFGGDKFIPVGGKPPTYPWYQSRYYNPEEIIPILGNYVGGTIHPVDGGIPIGAIVVILSDEPYYTFADENGTFLINNVSSGVHDVVVNLDGYVPYKQRFIHSSNTTVGVDGILHLIPESEAFRIQGSVTDVEGKVVANAKINVFDASGTKLFTTLTDEDGTYLVMVSEKDVYTVEALTDTKVGLTKVSGEAGGIVKANIIVGKGSIVAYIDRELQELINEVNALDINLGIKNSLIKKLENARSKNDQALDFIEANNMLTAEEKIINAFVSEVEAQSEKEIAEEDAAKLKEKAMGIRALIQLAMETPV